MALPVWGNLEKSQVDPEKIEEAIARLIQAHEDDPDAHLEVGESLQSHKVSEIIDHAVASIIGDKIKDWEIIKVAGAFERTDFHWWTVFESLDGFLQDTGGTGSVTLDNKHVELATGGNVASHASLVDELDIINIFSWDKRRKFRTRVFFYNNANQGGSIVTGLAENRPHTREMGFKIVNNKFYGIVGDGTAETELELIPWIFENTAYDLEIRYTPGVKVEFYINGTLRGEITTNLPSGTVNAGVLMYIRIGNDGAVDRKIKFSYFDFWQESS